MDCSVIGVSKESIVQIYSIRKWKYVEKFLKALKNIFMLAEYQEVWQF